MDPVLVFDIETIPDINGIRKLLGFDDSITDADVAECAMQRQRAQNGSSFLSHHLHRIIAIACVLRWSDKIIVKAIGTATDSEASLLQTFFDTIDRYTPQIVSWNGGGFDLPVMHYRAMIHGIVALSYWDMGDSNRDFKWNNYLNRYHCRHLDLMDLLALYQARASVPLDELANLCGFPGKLGMDGAKVWPAWLAGDIIHIRNYCETDAANTYLVYLRFQRMQGKLSDSAYRDEIHLLRHWLSCQHTEHWQTFLTNWPQSKLDNA